MKLILQKDVKNLGKAGDQVLVKKGYARNFLIPKGHALPIDKSRLKVWKHQQIIISAKKRKAVAERKALIEKLSGIHLKFEKEALKDGKLFGSVTAYEISQALEKLHNISVDKRDLSPSVLKITGDHTIKANLDSENQTDFKVSIKGKITKKSTEKEESQSETESPSALKKATAKITSFLKGSDEKEAGSEGLDNSETESIQTLKSAQAHSIKEEKSPSEEQAVAEQSDKPTDSTKTDKETETAEKTSEDK